ncbi:hypothetical protein TIFTF001_053187 [Ficus carica]|uniref:Uncharacterized protein n=1 Tax=Ficus carica TaxID=3494 RepID=A0AA88EGS2_FICCA|nr:hypothetical protein TIFTF001_053186 [Ficus carica]GMN74637.1 hypothetical protein TIFTF001_053187 [Ficus carica]
MSKIGVVFGNGIALQFKNSFASGLLNVHREPHEFDAPLFNCYILVDMNLKRRQSHFRRKGCFPSLCGLYSSHPLKTLKASTEKASDIP